MLQMNKRKIVSNTQSLSPPYIILIFLLHAHTNNPPPPPHTHTHTYMYNMLMNDSVTTNMGVWKCGREVLLLEEMRFLQDIFNWVC